MSGRAGRLGATNRARIAGRGGALAVGVVIAVQLSGCAAYPTETEPLMERDRGEPLAIEVNGEVVEEDDLLWAARVDGRTLVVTVPESSGCSMDVQLSGVDVASETIDIVATPEIEEACGANLFLSPKELLVDPDVRGFTVQVRIEH